MTDEQHSKVAVLGLGRMGTAIATRLSARGHDVVGWSRTPRDHGGLVTAATAAAAVADAEVVVMCLFDGPACRAVVEDIAPALGASSVLNTSTVSPAEAVDLAARVEEAGAAYVHVPVVGSVPAATGGTLALLVGGDDLSAPAKSVLADLGEIVDCGSVARAAAAKLTANGALGDALLVVRNGRLRARLLGLDDRQAWEVLERTPVGGLVRGKRTRLDQRRYADADFTAAALAKDLGLLAALAPDAAELRAFVEEALRAGWIRPDDDVAGLCVEEPAAGATGAHGLTIAAGVSAPRDVLEPLLEYVAGHATGDPGHHRRAFLPSAHVEGVRDGVFTSWSLDEFCALFPGRPAQDEGDRRRRLDRVDVAGTVATASMTLWHGDDVFTDVFLLVLVDGRWRIANKAYHRQQRA